MCSVRNHDDVLGPTAPILYCTACYHVLFTNCEGVGRELSPGRLLCILSIREASAGKLLTRSAKPDNPAPWRCRPTISRVATAMSG